MQKTFCGVDLNHRKLNDSSEASNDDNFANLDLNRNQLRSVSLLYHVIYSNPVILYTPNTKVIRDNLVKKVNSTFELFALINEFSTKWLNVSNEIGEYLKSDISSSQLLDDFTGMLKILFFIYTSVLLNKFLNKFSKQ